MYMYCTHFSERCHLIPSYSTCIQQRAVHKVSPPAMFPLTQAPPDFEPVVWSEFSLFFSADFLEVDGVTYVIKDSVAYKDCPDCGAAYPLPLLRSHIKVSLIT